MGKIDLIDNGWVDLVFEGKNQTYGAYQLRKNTGVRNLKALITMFVGFAIIAAIVIAKVSIENYIAAQNAAIEADVELASLAEKKEAKVEKKDEPEVEKIEVERVKSSVAFTVPEIKKDSEVKEDQEMKSQGGRWRSPQGKGSDCRTRAPEGGGIQSLRRGRGNASVPRRSFSTV